MFLIFMELRGDSPFQKRRERRRKRSRRRSFQTGSLSTKKLQSSLRTYRKYRRSRREQRHWSSIRAGLCGVSREFLVCGFVVVIFIKLTSQFVQLDDPVGA